MNEVGITGTRNGWTRQQQHIVTEILFYKFFSKFRHGDCKGSDKLFHYFVTLEMKRNEDIYIHPPNSNSLRAFCQSPNILPSKPYLDRNWDIANEVDVLLATPKEMQEIIRSGTWSTVRYARKLKKIIYIIFPDGTIKEEI